MPLQVPIPTSALFTPDTHPVQTSQADSATPITPVGGGFSSVKATSPVATTSGPATTYANNLGNNIASAQDNPPATFTGTNPTGTPSNGAPQSYTWYDGTVNATPDPYGFGTSGYDPINDPRVASDATTANSVYADREQQLQQQRDDEIAALGNKQSKDVATQEATASAQNAMTFRNLTYLQNGSMSASAQAYMNSLDQTHQKEMDTLTASYNAAVASAKNAFSDKDFALAESMTKNAKDIKDAAATKNQNYLNDMAKAQAQATADARLQLAQTTAQQTFLKNNGVTSLFYQYPGSPQVYDSKTGKQISMQEYQSLGGVGGDFKDIQVIDPNAQKESPSYLEWQNYKSQGGTLDYNAYQTMDANRKAPRITNVTYNQTQDQQLKADIAQTQKNLTSVAGTDNHVTVQDWRRAYNEWIQSGHTAKEFTDNFSGFVNPNSKDPYFGK